MIPEALSIGRAVLSVRLLLIFGSVGGGLLATWVLLGNRRSALRSRLVDTLSTAGLLFLLSWKSAALLSQFATIRREPLLLLWASGGRLGVVIGSVAVLGYLGWQFSRRTDAAQLVRATALTLAASLTLLLLLYSAVALTTVAGAAGGFSARVGDTAPPLELETLDGATLDVAQLRGAPVLVNFWATWCAPCRAETAVKRRLAQEFSGRAHVVGVNLTNSESGVHAVRDYARQWDLSYPVLLDHSGSAAASYGVRGTPTTVVLDADGAVHSRIFGAMSYDAAARALQQAGQRWK